MTNVFALVYVNTRNTLISLETQFRKTDIGYFEKSIV